MRAFVIVVISAILAGCGGPARSETADRSNTEEAVQVNDRLYVARPSGLAVVNVATGRVERELPLGLMSADRTAYWAVEPGAMTAVKKLDPISGSELARVQVTGRFDLPRQYGPPTDAISISGRYLVLAGVDEPSTFVVLDLKDGREHRRATLRGKFTFDAIDDFGQSLYLHEHPQPGSDKYNVRLYDLSANTLASKAITDQKVPEPTAADLARGTMGGVYHASATAAYWHFGLYTTATRGPVIHALNMASRWASCLLDLTTVTTHRSAWAIVPSAKGDRVFAVNAANGAFASVDASSLQMARRTFAVRAGRDGDLRGSAVASADGTRLYAAGGNGVLAIDAHTLSMKGQYLVDREFASVMVSPDGTRLYVLDRDGAISRIEPGTGRDLGVVARLPNAVSIVRLD